MPIGKASEKKKCRDKKKEENTYSSLLEECLSGGFAGRVASFAEMLHVHKGGCREHDGMVEQQADLPTKAIAVVDNGEERMKVHQRHVRVHIFNVGLDERILQRKGG